METLIPEILRQAGIPGVIFGFLYLILSREIEHLKKALSEHIGTEKGIWEKIEDLRKELSQMTASVNRILSYMEGRNDKGK